ncbi:RloB family protein [Desulfovibrio falkowii]|uniref:RloB family protein n=1 Tax=Desulfovibrio sp. WGS1351 TaxID=3366814 RepID=UPI00372D86FF
MVTDGRKRHVQKEQAKVKARQEIRAQVMRHKSLGLALEGGVRPDGRQVEKKRFLIVCEGKNTEPQYFKKLSHAWRLLVDVNVLSAAGAPEQLVNEAIAAKERVKDNYYNEVWLVFDKDDIAPQVILDARSKAINNGINVAFSNECFELWLLLHFQDDGWQVPRRELPAALDAHLRGYSNDKSISDKHFKQLRATLPDAVRRACWLDKNKELDGDLETCPYTSVHELVKTFCSCKTTLPHIQEEIDAIFANEEKVFFEGVKRDGGKP